MHCAYVFTSQHMDIYVCTSVFANTLQHLQKLFSLLSATVLVDDVTKWRKSETRFSCLILFDVVDFKHNKIRSIDGVGKWLESCWLDCSKTHCCFCLDMRSEYRSSSSYKVWNEYQLQDVLRTIKAIWGTCHVIETEMVLGIRRVPN